MPANQLKRVSSIVLVLLSMSALVTVVTGLRWPAPLPEPDEGTRRTSFSFQLRDCFRRLLSSSPRRTGISRGGACTHWLSH
jgi:hypothetical protein